MTVTDSERVARQTLTALSIGSGAAWRPALADGRSLVPFCSTECRDIYAEFVPGWGLASTQLTEPLNNFGRSYWRTACSTCGKAL